MSIQLQGNYDVPKTSTFQHCQGDDNETRLAKSEVPPPEICSLDANWKINQSLISLNDTSKSGKQSWMEQLFIDLLPE